MTKHARGRYALGLAGVALAASIVAADAPRTAAVAAAAAAAIIATRVRFAPHAGISVLALVALLAASGHAGESNHRHRHSTPPKSARDGGPRPSSKQPSKISAKRAGNDIRRGPTASPNRPEERRGHLRVP